MKKYLLTFSVSILSLCFLAEKGTAQDVPGGSSDGIDSAEIVDPAQLKLTNYPNPVHTTTTVKYDMPTDGNVSLKLYNAAGQPVKTIFAGYKKAGSHETSFDAYSISRGIYVCALSVSNGNKNSRLTSMMNVIK